MTTAGQLVDAPASSASRVVRLTFLAPTGPQAAGAAHAGAPEGARGGGAGASVTPAFAGSSVVLSGGANGTAQHDDVDYAESMQPVVYQFFAETAADAAFVEAPPWEYCDLTAVRRPVHGAP